MCSDILKLSRMIGIVVLLMSWNGVRIGVGRCMWVMVMISFRSDLMMSGFCIGCINICLSESVLFVEMLRIVSVMGVIMMSWNRMMGVEFEVLFNMYIDIGSLMLLVFM